MAADGLRGMPPLVSILIPCYNAEQYIGEAVESALGQTYPNVEVVVVDDGSTDGSVGVLESFGDRIRFEAGPNRGGCAARNRALSLSRGEYIQYLDADDVLLPGKIERQIGPLIEGTADMVICQGYRHYDNEPPKLAPFPNRDPEESDALDYCLNQQLYSLGPLHRRTMVERVGGYRESVRKWQEYDLHIRLAAHGARIRLIKEPLFRIRKHKNTRVSEAALSFDYKLGLVADLAADVIEGRIPVLEKSARDALSQSLFADAVWAYRAGNDRAAHLGYGMAKQVGGDTLAGARWWYRAIAGVVGPFHIERGLAIGRSLRSRVKRLVMWRHQISEPKSAATVDK